MPVRNQEDADQRVQEFQQELSQLNKKDPSNKRKIACLRTQIWHYQNWMTRRQKQLSRYYQNHDIPIERLQHKVTNLQCVIENRARTDLEMMVN